MRTYWLHSVWVLGFFLSLFSLQGKFLLPARTSYSLVKPTLACALAVKLEHGPVVIIIERYLGLLGISVVFYEFTGNKIKTKIAIQDKSGLYAIRAMVELVEGRVKKSKRNIRRLDEFCCDSWGLLDTTSTQCYLKNKPYQNDASVPTSIHFSPANQVLLFIVTLVQSCRFMILNHNIAVLQVSETDFCNTTVDYQTASCMVTISVEHSTE
ncbi:hypothetical protein MJG53_001065 [Ovis ammon polii x Ovis aries]|uniref:Uncharacterized protein n=1 Tax=Ovis ammon polii x Ovis aries TaxID=2918886 RepID=A0ACB9VKN2_9CETA|nr:hypothetical protein MJT46_000561 [Ovis ammon polii x Ovis aries]KAI4590016.1 hypothetical protein MJG53_001065 [Ovis ammon polii x Ovis aries]